MRLLKWIRQIFFGTYARGFVASYFIVALIGAILLSMPFSLQAGVSLSRIDAWFVSMSALSVTGLTPIVVKDVFSTTGQVIMLFIIQFGGIGLVMMLALFWLAVRKKIGFKHRNMIMTDQNQLSRAGIVRFIRNVLIVIFTIEIVAFFVIWKYLFFAGYFPYQESGFQALFLTISLFTNAGFDIAPGGDSFQMFKTDYVMQSIGILLMFLGSVGFWVLAEGKEWIVAKVHKEKFEFSIFVKFIFVLHVLFWLVGAVVIYALEFNHYFADKGFIESIYYALFMSITTRNAGLSTLDVNYLTESTNVYLMVLMFIGASPNSVGGGIRTTTIVIVILAMRAFARGHEEIVVFSRQIKKETISKAFVALSAALFIVVTGVIIIGAIEDLSIESIAFEVVSAFGTTGLSMGITSMLHTASKLILVLIMFIGRVGILALLLMFKPDRKVKGYVHYPEMDVIVG